MKRWTIALMAVLVLVPLIGLTASAADYPKIGLILATGGLGDKSFNDQAYLGATQACTAIADEYGVTLEDVLDYVEPAAIAEYAGFQLQFADAGIYDLIVCIGFDHAAALEVTATDYPDQQFVIVDMVVFLPNVASIVNNDYESAFLIGVAAASLSQTGTVGFLGGKDEPLINNFLTGYTQGAQWADPDVTVVHRYVGFWDNPTLGAELSREMYTGGVDYIYGAAGKSHLGVFTAAEENEAWFAFGTDVDQAATVPESADVIVGSGVKRVDLFVKDTIEEAAAGTWAGGIYAYGMTTDFGYGTGIFIGKGFGESDYVFPSASTVEVPNSVISAVVRAAYGLLDGSIQITGLAF